MKSRICLISASSVINIKWESFQLLHEMENSTLCLSLVPFAKV